MPSECIPKRLKWACRRGMLELDLWLDQFIINSWSQLSAEDKKVFEIMLEEPDPILYRWLTLQEIPSDPTICSIINLIRHDARR
jgi:antitoxin CptB